MYSINVDILKKLIIIQISGSLQYEEIIAYTRDLTETAYKFEVKELSMLILAQRMDPIPQDCIEEFKKSTKILLIHMKKVAVVHARFITQMQMKRIEDEVRSEIVVDSNILRCNSKIVALEYLNE